MTNKRKSTLLFWTSIFVTYGIPIIAIINKYNLVAQFKAAPTKVKKSLFILFILALIILAMMSKIKLFLDNLDFSLLKCLLYGLIKSVPFLLGLVIVFNIMYIVDDLQFILSCITPR